MSTIIIISPPPPPPPPAPPWQQVVENNEVGLKDKKKEVYKSVSMMLLNEIEKGCEITCTFGDDATIASAPKMKIITIPGYDHAVAVFDWVNYVSQDDDGWWWGFHEAPEVFVNTPPGWGKNMPRYQIMQTKLFFSPTVFKA